MLGAESSQSYSKEAYFSLLEQSEEKLEYHDGMVIAMAGGSSNHSIIATNTITNLSFRLRDRDCVVFNSDMAIAISASNRYVFPDISVCCGNRAYEDEKQTRLKNPSLIIEVLSEGTEAYDRGAKFAYYRSLPSFKEYIIIASDRIWVESFYRKAKDAWHIFSSNNLDKNLTIQSLNLDVPIRELYLKTEGLT